MPTPPATPLPEHLADLPFVLRPPRRLKALMLVSTLAGALLGLGLVLNGFDFGWLILAVMVPSLAMSLVFLLPGSRHLRITRQGLYHCKMFRTRSLRWDGITEFLAYDTGYKSRSIMIRTRPGAQPDIIPGFGYDEDTLAATLNSLREEALANPEPRKAGS